MPDRSETSQCEIPLDGPSSVRNGHHPEGMRAEKLSP